MRPVMWMEAPSTSVVGGFTFTGFDAGSDAADGAAGEDVLQAGKSEAVKARRRIGKRRIQRP